MWYSPAQLEPALRQRREQQAWRMARPWRQVGATTITYGDHQLLNFASNDYLGLARHDAVKTAAIEAIHNFGVGSTSAALVCGQSKYHTMLEERLASFLGKPKALLFSSGYSANLAVLGTFLDAKKAIFQDRLNHASLLEGGLQSGAYMRRYAHANVGALTRLLEQHKGRDTLVATDAVFSMDGDMAPLEEIQGLCRDYEALLYVDDAHGFGVLGPNGEGTFAALNIPAEAMPLTLITFGKALGVAGAAVVGDAHLVDYLQQFAKPYMFTTAMPPAMAAAALKALEVMQDESWRREKALGLAQYFRQEATKLGYTVAPSNTPIQPLMVGSNEAALGLGEWLFTQGILATAIRPPTVPQGTARLRITMTAAHTQADVEQLLSSLALAPQRLMKAR